MENILTESISHIPDIKISSKQVFGTEQDLKIPAFSNKTDLVPKIDKNYFFDNDTTISILTGFSENKRVLIQGYHGTGKTTHIEQIAARLNWPCIRINLDSHITRGDLIGKDTIILKNATYNRPSRSHLSVSFSWKTDGNLSNYRRLFGCFFTIF